MLGDLLLKTVDKYVDVFIEALAAKYDLPKNELKELWKESSGRGKKAISYKKMKLGDLQKLCEERDIDVKKSRKKQLYIDALEEHDKTESLDSDGHEETKSEPKESEKMLEENPLEIEAQPKDDVIEDSKKVDEMSKEVASEPQSEKKESDHEVDTQSKKDETPQDSDIVKDSKEVEKKEIKKKQKTPDTGIEKHVELIKSMEENKDVLDMSYTELKKFCKEKGMDIRQKNKQQLLDWVELKEKTTDFSEFLTDVNDLI
jgi:hypothetical protein